jgi:MerR family transcriptional regulator, copper efflux regulator
VTQLRISELAERSGVPSSTLRYYERIGLVRPVGRSDNGYRVYDDHAVDRLAFIGRAKRLGMSLEHVATLVDIWFTGECEPLQDRLRVFLGGRIGELRRQIADESAFARQLQRILDRLDRLDHDDAAPERCGPDCGCDTDPLETPVALERAPSGEVMCSLSPALVPRRVAAWQQLLATAKRTERVGTGWRIAFRAERGVASELARLCAAETECCPFFAFGLEFTADAIVLTVDGSEDSVDVFAALLAGATPSAPTAPELHAPEPRSRPLPAVGVGG